MTKQELLYNRWRVFINYGGSVPLPDHLGGFLTGLRADISAVDDPGGPLVHPNNEDLMARIYHVSSSLPQSPRQTLVVGWIETDPWFTLTTEEVS